MAFLLKGFMMSNMPYDRLVFTSSHGAQSRGFPYHLLVLQVAKGCKHLFTHEEYNSLTGPLRNGDLSVCQSPLVSSRLERAKVEGDMSVADFRALYQLYSFSKKLPVKGDNSLCEQNALKKMLAGEAQCRLTNQTMAARLSSNPDLFNRVQRLIGSVIGWEVPVTLFTSTDVEFGPGSTINVDSRSFRHTALFYKITDKLVIPRKAMPYLAAHLSAHPNWVDMLGCHYHLNEHDNESRLQFELRVFFASLSCNPG